MFNKSGNFIGKPPFLTKKGAGHKNVLIINVQKGAWKINNISGVKSKPFIINNTEQLVYFKVTNGIYKFTMHYVV